MYRCFVGICSCFRCRCPCGRRVDELDDSGRWYCVGHPRHGRRHFTGDYSFAQINGNGFNYWNNPSTPYISATVPNAPPNSDIIALNNGGSKTITFSQAVENPVIGLVSWNGNTVDFGVPIKILSYGTGYWGYGIPELNGTGTGFYGNGEVHGVIELPGSFTSITFTDTSENWHGLTVGAAPVPIPGALLLFGPGLAGIAAIRRRFKK